MKYTDFREKIIYLFKDYVQDGEGRVVSAKLSEALSCLLALTTSVIKGIPIMSTKEKLDMLDEVFLEQRKVLVEGDNEEKK